MKTSIQHLFLIFLIIAFISGIIVNLNGGIFYKLFTNEPSISDPFDNQDSDKPENVNTDLNCPTMLIRKGEKILLYNKNAPELEGSNPLPFLTMDEYLKYLVIQKKNGMDCPVLYLQQESDVQGNDVMRIRPSPFDMNGGAPTVPIVYQKNVDSSLENPPYNQGQYAGFDPTNQDSGILTDLDKIHNSTKENGISDNAMDPNWGGVMYSQDAILSGKYKDNEITKVLYPKLSN
jgi:hypothetical protein